MLFFFNPHLLGGGWLPLENFSLSPQNQKESDLRHLGNLNDILCSHSDEMLRGVTVSCQRWWIQGGCHLKKNQKSPIFRTFSVKFSILAYYYAENQHFQVNHVVVCHCDVIRWSIFMILISMERGDPILNYAIKQLHFGYVNFNSTWGG